MMSISRNDHKVLPRAILYAVGLAAVLGPAVARQRAAPALSYSEIAQTIRVEGLRSEGAFAVLERLLQASPRRMTGSPGYSAAAAAMLREMKNLGLETWLEPVSVEHWIRGTRAEAIVREPDLTDTRPLRIAALGLSVPTPGQGIEASVVEVTTFDELQAMASEVRGKIVFFNHPMNPALMDTFTAYGEAAAYRTRGASEAAKLGAAAVLVRSLTLRRDDAPHAGMVGYDPAAPKIPAAALSTLDSDWLSLRLHKKKELRVSLRIDCRDLGPVESSIVIGQWRGTERPDEIILLGAHLDSWDLGPGAHDDGAGCAQCLEAVRLIRASGVKPKRTIRIALYPNEEFGAGAGLAYARSPRRKGEKHIAAMESDRGGFLPIGFGLGTGAAFEKLKIWEGLLEPSGIQWVRPGGGGADIGPLAEQGTVLMGFIPDNQRYFDYHHSANDVLSAVHPRELELGAIVTAIMTVVVSEEGI